jgi:putative photosynthetic complex assembly protein 2
VPDFIFPVLFALLIWWFSTGLILYLDSLPPRTFRRSMLGATAVLIAALYGLATSSVHNTIAAAYIAFTSAVLVWGWLEMAFLMGFITGPRPAPAPPGATGWSRFRYATLAILYHELSLVAGAVVVLALTWGAENQLGWWTFLTLWIMRLSAKLNLFLGVPQLNAELLPEHLQFLKSYLTKKSMNFLFPVSMIASVIAAVIVVQRLIASRDLPFESTGLTLVAALIVLAIVEHWLMILPIPATKLWDWRSRSSEPVKLNSL